ncbi:MAG: glycosyl hydrolase family 18 protein [Candidatus Limnocylindrales bacterium]
MFLHRLRAARTAVIVMAVVLFATPAIPTPVAADVPLAPLTVDQVTHRLSKEVFGYLPYWELDGGTDANLRYDLLSTIAFFGVNANSDGTLNTSLPGYAGYLSANATTIIQHAHAMGVRTVITFQSFGTSKNAAFFTNPTAQATAIQQLVALMQARGADGANVDVEEISGTYFPAYASFVGALRQAAIAVNPNAQVTVATNAATSGARMAAAAVGAGADRAFLMGYNYRTGGSSPAGSIDPLVRAGGGLSLTTTLDTYASYGVPMDHVILGLPFYGITWPTISADLRAPAQPASTYYASLFLPSSLPGSAAGATMDYDPVEQSARLTIFDPVAQTWYQTYYDDPTALTVKLALVNQRSLAGAGFWALGYEQGQPGYWDSVTNAFGASKLSAVVITPGATKGVDVTVSPVWQDVGSPTTSIRLSNDGVNWSAWLPISASVPWQLAAGLPDGPRTVSVQILNAIGGMSSVVSGEVIVDTVAPVATAPTVAAAVGTTAGTAGDTAAVVSWSAADAGSGVASYLLEMSQDGAPFTPVTLPTAAATSVATHLVPGHLYQWRVTPTDAAGNVGATVTGLPIRPQVYQENSGAIRYTPSWQRYASSPALGGAATWSAVTTATATFTFSGSSVALIAPLGPIRGVAKIIIDGVPVTSVNLYSPAGHSRQVAWVRSWPTYGPHTIALRVLGTARHPRIDIDAFVVLR